eukprot:gnl/Chilomastix_cuspidata/374.p1 GENE.gnl/Chilomastix_cuspidata/374~~gnl/Chilomastix_cuspidata/374.p1  ORF type:complete len:396 (+),score=154.73 gnl/Chilomastix_cuspidata/374:1351-2538(+)
MNTVCTALPSASAPAGTDADELHSGILGEHGIAGLFARFVTGWFRTKTRRCSIFRTGFVFAQMTQTETCIRHLAHHTRPVNHVMFSHDSDLAFSSDLEGVCISWRAKTGDLFRSYVPENPNAIMSFDVSRDGTMIAIYYREDLVVIFDVLTAKILLSIPHRLFGAGSVRFALGDTQLLIMSDPCPSDPKETPSTGHIYDISDARRGKFRTLGQFDVPDSMRVVGCEWGPLNRHIFVSARDGHVAIFNARTLQLERTMKLFETELFSIRRVPNAAGLLVCGDKAALLLDARNFELVATFEFNTLARTAALHPRVPLIALAGGIDPKIAAQSSASPETEFRIQFLDGRAGEQLGSLKGHRGTVHSVAFSNDGLRMVSGCEDSGVLLIEFAPSILAFK